MGISPGEDVVQLMQGPFVCPPPHQNCWLQHITRLCHIRAAVLELQCSVLV